MKTVMKKMFCLMLVAVMLVGVMPFQAFALGECPCTDATHTLAECPNYCSACSQEGHDESETHCAVCKWYVGHAATCTSGCDNSAGCTWDKTHNANCLSQAVCEHCSKTADHFSADCPTYCTKCSQNGHDESQAHCASCNWYVGHAADCPTLTCTICGQPAHGGSPCCAECKNITGGHEATCTSGCDKTANCTWAYTHKADCVSQHTCTICSKAGHMEANCPTIICSDCGASVKNGKHETDCIELCTGDRNCPNTATGHHNTGCAYALCNLEGCKNTEGHAGEHTGVPCDDKNCDYSLNHAGKHSYLCPEAACDLPVNHGGLHSFEHEYKAGSSDLEIWVNLHTANVETKTRLLVTYEDLSADTLIYEFIADRRDEIQNMLYNYYGKDYEWSGHVYDSASAKNPVRTNDDLDEGAAVYINAYTYQDLVYVYVHNNRSYNNIRVILFEGKQIGDTISRSEIVDVVNDYYGLNSLLMYSEDDWKKVVKGKSVNARENLVVTEEPFHIDVLISGTATAGSGYTADSTNPKTGDMIMTPAIVMCASISALAALFYLNKKRAI